MLILFVCCSGLLRCVIGGIGGVEYYLIGGHFDKLCILHNQPPSELVDWGAIIIKLVWSSFYNVDIGLF